MFWPLPLEPYQNQNQSTLIELWFRTLKRTLGIIHNTTTQPTIMVNIGCCTRTSTTKVLLSIRYILTPTYLKVSTVVSTVLVRNTGTTVRYVLGRGRLISSRPRWYLLELPRHTVFHIRSINWPDGKKYVAQITTRILVPWDLMISTFL